MKYLLLLLGVTILGSLTAQEPIYLLHDASCMQRLEYRFNNTVSGNKLVTYKIARAGGQQTFYLETGLDKGNLRTDRPASTVSCVSQQLGPEVVNSINDRSREVYIVRPLPEGYNVSRVTAAAYQSQEGDRVRLLAADYDFTFSTSAISSGINLSRANTGAEIFFRNRQYNATCDQLEQYEFRRLPQRNTVGYTDIVYLPGVGIIIERTGKSDVEARENQLQLVAIDGQVRDEYLEQRCTQLASSGSSAMYTDALAQRKAELRAELGDALTESSATDIAPTPPPNNTMASKGSSVTSNSTPRVTPTEMTIVQGPCRRPVMDDMHLILPGDTYYGIAQQYDITVEQLLHYNALDKSQPLYPCNYLLLVRPEGMLEKPRVATGSTPNSPNVMISRGTNVTSATTDCNATAPQGYHKVAQGETLFRIAVNYGVTVERLRTWNAMGSDNIIQPCMLLKVQGDSPATAYYLNQRPKELLVTTAATETSEPLKAKGSSTMPTLTPTRTDYDPALAQQRLYVVKEGDSLYAVARRAGLTVERLAAMNRLSLNALLMPGQELIVNDCTCAID